MRSRQHSYRERLLGALVGVLALTLVLVRSWPAPTEEAPSTFRDRPAERIQVREVQPTSQSQERTPPPPAPLPPVVVPDEVLVTEEIDFGEAELQVDVPDPEDDAQLRDGAEQATAARTPDTGARLLRNVQPTYPTAAQEEDVRARIKVAVEVDPEGRVQSATIQQRWRLHPDGSSEIVEELEYGLEEAALVAARRSLFRPARHRGEPVATRTVLTFTFGRE